MVDVGSYVGNIVDSAMEPVDAVVGDVVGSVGDIATDLGGGIAGLAQDTGSLAQDVYNNTVNDPGAMMGIANVAGRVGGIPGLAAVAGPASIALGYMGQGERDKTLGINNPTALGRLARSLVPSIVQRPVFDLLGVTGDHSFDGYGTAEAEEEGVAGIDTSGTNPNAAIGGGETRHDADEPDSYGEVEDIEDYEDYDEDQYAQGGAVGFAGGGLQNEGGLATLYEEIGSLGDFETKERITSGKGIERSNRGMVWKFAEGNMPEWMKGVITPKDYSLKFNRGVSADVRAGVAGDRADVNLGVDERILGRNLRGDVTIPTKLGLLKLLTDREMNKGGRGVTTTGASFSAPVLGGILSAKKTSNPYLDRFQANYAKDFGNAGRIIAGMQEVNNRRALQAAYEREVLGGQGRVDVERTPDGETSVMGRLSFPLN